MYLQSGTSNVFWGTYTPQQAATNAELLANMSSCSNNDTFIQCLRDLPAEDLERYGRDIFFVPTIDGSTLLEDPLDLIASGNVERKDVLIGKFISNYP